MGVIWMRRSDFIKGYIEHAKWERLEPNLKSLLHMLLLEDISEMKSQLTVMHNEHRDGAEDKLREVEAYRETLVQRGLV